MFRRAGLFAANALAALAAGGASAQAERFLTVINRSTAAKLGLKIPPEVLLRADRVVE